MAAPLPKAPIVLLGLMTLFTFGGPLAIFLTLRGGRSPDWPPDRAVEWWTFGLITGSVAVLMIACLGVGAFFRKQASRENAVDQRRHAGRRSHEPDCY